VLSVSVSDGLLLNDRLTVGLLLPLTPSLL
jgi:hypothetical protein